jgi:hypothetical protein
MKLYMDVGGTTIRCELHTYDSIVRETFVSREILKLEYMRSNKK